MNACAVSGRLGLAALLLLAGCVRDPAAREARHLERGKKHREQRDYGRALIDFRNAASLMPKDAEPYFQIALTNLASGDLRGAIASLHQAAALDPKHAGAQLKLAELMSATNDEELVGEAREKIRAVMSAAPDNPEALELLGLTELQLGSMEQAEAHLKRVIDRSPDRLKSAVALAHLKLAQGKSAEAEAEMRKLVRNAPDSAEAHLALAQFYLAAGRHQEARSELEEAVRIEPANGPANIALATLALHSDRLREAESRYAALLNSPDPEYRALHADFLVSRGRFAEALAGLEELAERNRNDRRIRSRLTALYFATGRGQEAEEKLNHALRANAKDVDALQQRGALMIQRKNFAQAEQDLLQVIEQDAGQVQARYLLSLALAGRGKRHAQTEQLALVLGKKPDYLRARLDLARLHVALGQPAVGLEWLDKAPESQRGHSQTIAVRNWALMALGRSKDAAAAIGALSAKGIQTPELLFQDGLLKLWSGDRRGARSSFEQILVKDPEDSNALLHLLDLAAMEGDIAAGVRKIEESVKQRPKSERLRSLLGYAFLRQRNLAAARREFEVAKSLRSDPGSPDISLAEVDILEGRREAAHHRLLAVSGIASLQAPANLILGELCERSGDAAGAVRHYTLALEADENSAAAHNNLAVLLGSRDPGRALKHAMRAAALAPGNGAIQDTLGWILYQQGSYDAAIGHLQRSVAVNPAPARRLLHLGMAYQKKNDQRAEKYLAQALALDPKVTAQ